MPNMNLSSRGLILKLQATGKQYEVYDEREAGLGIRVGAKKIAGLGRPKLTWIVRERPPGTRNKVRITIGIYGDEWTPTKARHKAAEIKTQIRNGIDPNADKKIAAETLTVKEAYEIWLEHRPKRPTKDTIKNQTRSMNNLGALTNRRLDQISRLDVAKVFRVMTDNNGHVGANSAVKLLNAIYRFHAGDFNLTNPVEAWKVKGGKMHPEIRRKIHEEGASYVLPRWRKAFDVVVTNPVVMDILLWGFYSGIRKSEILALKFLDFEVERGSYQITVLKNDVEGGKVWTLPLNRQLADILARCFEERLDGNPYLFPSPKIAGKKRHNIVGHTDRLYAELSDVAGVKFWAHGMRNAFLTVASRGLFLPDTLAKRLVGHEAGEKDGDDPTEGYKNAWTLGQLRTVSQRVADRIDDHVAGRVEEDEIAGDFALNDPRLEEMRRVMAA